ncbi:MAG: CBS domain-containing protein [Syntrophobacterales bacterium]|nr:MAG: CBS domain-containing protein [Syntrophobacterales bacterium]
MKRQGIPNSKKGEPHVKLGKVIATLKGRKIPLVREESTIKEVIDAMVRHKHTRLLYVVDEDGKLLGTIALGPLVRHVFGRSHEPKVHPWHIMSMITTEMAKDIMEKNPIFAAEGEDVEVVLRRMIGRNVKEIAVLDNQKRVVADVTMIDLLKFL